jgi:hypothetical protein
VRFVFISTLNLQRGRAFVVGIANLSKQAVTQDKLLRVWDEFSYRMDVVHAAGGGHIEHL